MTAQQKFIARVNLRMRLKKIHGYLAWMTDQVKYRDEVTQIQIKLINLA